MVFPALAFEHDVPASEPPEGSVAVFRKALTDGSVSHEMLIRTMFGWADSPAGGQCRRWETLTTRDSNVGAVQVRVIAQRGNHRERYAELEAAVYAAAERLKIPTRVFRTGVGTQDIPPLALIAEMELRLNDACLALVAAQLHAGGARQG